MVRIIISYYCRAKSKELASTWRLSILSVDRLWEYNLVDVATGNKHPLEGEMLQGTLDLLILQTLVLGAAHGHTIAHAIERRSEDVLQVEHGSLYPALHRLEDRGWIASFWGTSENNRKARYYRLTVTGRKQLIEQTSRWERLARAVNRVLRPAEE
jgi:PadR family transcriptional regulator PadR